MGFSHFLEARREAARALVAELHKDYSYVSVLGSDVRVKSIMTNKNTSAIRPGRDMECGFVAKMSSGSGFFEYSVDDIGEDIPALAAKIREAFALQAKLNPQTISQVHLPDEPLKKDFCRESDLEAYTDDQLLTYCGKLCKEVLSRSENLLNVTVSLGIFDVSKLFVSVNRELSQNYAWINGRIMAVYQENDKVVQVREGAYDCKMAPVLEELPTHAEKLLHKAHCLAYAKPIVPGVYDCVTDSSITGLIAHEAFGHGVEMDQFVKDRALAQSYVGKYVASPICNMHDGADATLSVASYFFDDDGVLAHDTKIIENGILLTGISDLASAVQLGTEPTGNGRRESTRHKAYTRMTNTFFEKGSDKLEDMIGSIDHGYMLFETNNGMEDPKNWAIQCVAEYGIEIRDGKLTDNYVSPVVMSGYVPDLLKSISMISGDFEIEGSGMCGKGYKEWVRVSDGGPALKVKVKLG